VVQDQYLVVFHTNVSIEIRDFHVTGLKQRMSIRQVDSFIAAWAIGDLVGYSAKLSKETLLEELEDSKVRYIEADQVVTLSDEDVTLEDIETQFGVTWGIDRIDQRTLPLDGSFSYWVSAGTGVDAYVIDTGILLSHNEMGGRAIAGTNTVPTESPNDCNGHGTHVAGTIGGTVYGAAKKVTLFSVKVLGCSGSGTWAGVIQGVEWVTNSYRSRGRPAVANMSLGGAATATVDAAVANSIAAGVNYAIAAGNNNGNACNYSPARVVTAVGAGATTNTDARASFSNWGTCVAIFAPGNGITSAWIGSNTALNTISGTSMAAPHVAGTIALRLGHLPSAGPPATVYAWMRTVGTQGAVINPGTGSPNILTYSPIAD